MFRRRVGWNGLGGYGGLNTSVNARFFGHSQLGGYGTYRGYGSYGSYRSYRSYGAGGYGELGVSTLLLTALVI